MKHIPPTAEQKLKIYKAVRECILENNIGTRCICNALNAVQEHLGYVDSLGHNFWSHAHPHEGMINHIADNFPELVKLKPENKLYGQTWWKVNNEVNPERLEAVDKMIADVEAQILAKKQPKMEKKEFTLAEAIRIQNERLYCWKSVLKPEKYLLLLEHVAMKNIGTMEAEKVFRGQDMDMFVYNSLMDKGTMKSEFDVQPKSNF